MKIRIFILLWLFPLWLNAQTETAVINGKMYYVYPFQATGPQFGPDFLKGVKFRENWDEGMRKIEAVQEVVPASASEKKLLAKARKEAPWIWYSEWNNMLQVMPSPDSLPDGEYVLYFPGLPYVDGDTLKYRFQTVAAFFSMRENLFEGDFTFFTTNGKVKQTGSYLNGLPEGKWMTVYDYGYNNAATKPKARAEQLQRLMKEGRSGNRQEAYENYSKGNKHGICETYGYSDKMSGMTRQAFENGLPHGIYEQYTGKSLLTKGEYDHNMPSGEWFHYVLKDPADVSLSPEMQLIRHYIYPEERKTGKGPIIRDLLYESDNDTIYGGGFSVQLKEQDATKSLIVNQHYILFDYFYDIPQTDTLLAKQRGMKYFDYGWMQINNLYSRNFMNVRVGKQAMTRQQAIDSVGYDFKYSFYEEFYPNGQLLLRLKVNDGQLEKEDTIFWDNGQPGNVVNYLPETNQYEEKLFDRNGRLMKHDLFDSKGALLKTLVNSTSKIPASIRLNERDYTYNQNLGAYTYQPYVTPLDTQTVLIKESRLPSDSSIIETTIYDTLSHKLTHEEIFGKLSMHAEATIDTSLLKMDGSVIVKMGDWSRTEVLHADYSLYPYYIRRDNRLMMLANVFYQYAATPLLYKDQSFSGKIELQFGSDSTYAEQGKGVQRFFIGNNFYEKRLFDQLFQHVYFAGTEYKIPKIKFPGKVTGSFKNGYPDGKWKVTFANGKTRTRFTYADSVLNGVQKIYSYADPKDVNDYNNYFMDSDTFPEKPVYYLRNEIVYEKGFQVESTQYDWTGRITQMYNKEISLSRQGNMVTRTFRNETNDSIIALVSLDRGGKEHLVKREATWFVPKQVVQDTIEPVSADLAIKPEFGRARTDERIYHENGKLLHQKITDSLGRTVFFEAYASNGDLSEKVIWREGKPLAYERWENGTLKRRFDFSPEDSVQFSTIRLLRPETKMPSTWSEAEFSPYNNYHEDDRASAYQTNFDPDGTVRSEGRIEKMIKSGKWKYYNTFGKLVAEIDYTRDSLLIDSTDLHMITDKAHFSDSSALKFYVTGKRTLFDANKKPVAVQWIIEWSTNYSCVQDEYYETRNYYTVSETDTTLHLRNGWAKHRDENGSLQSEGKTVNGLPEGFWKFYNPDGTVKEAGMYRKGKRHGRWLSGDLSKINYLGDLCMSEDVASSEEKLRSLRKALDITVTYYQMGRKISVDYFNGTMQR